MQQPTLPTLPTHMAAVPGGSAAESNEASGDAPPKQVAMALERLGQASRLIADIRIGADRLLEALSVVAEREHSSKPLHLIFNEAASMRRHLQDLRSVGRQLEDSGVLNDSLISRSNSWGLHMPLVCPDGAVVAYAWKRQLAGQAGASAVDRTRLALKAFNDQKRRFFPHLDTNYGGEGATKKLCGPPSSDQEETWELKTVSEVLKHLKKEVPDVITFSYQRLDWLKRATSLPSSTSENSIELSEVNTFQSTGSLRQGSSDDDVPDKVAIIEVLIPSVFRAIVSVSMTTSQLHIAFLAFPFGTHATPLLTLVQKISPFLPSSTIFSFFNTSSSNSSIFSKVPNQENIKIYNVWDGVKEGNDTPFGLEAIKLFIQSTPTNFEKSLKEAEEETGVKFSCIFSDAFLWFSCEIAKKMNVPWVAFWTGGSCSLSVHLYTDLIRSNKETSLKIPGFSSTLSINDIPPEVTAEDLEGPMSSMLYNMALNLHKADAVVLNSFQELDPLINKDLQKNLQKVFNIGPLVLQSSRKLDESGCIQWLDKQKEKSVVYLSFGTVTTLPPNEIGSIAEALETKKTPFIWSLRNNGVKNLPKGFLERTKEFGKIVSWAPQLEILAHKSVGVFVTHCGWNSILEGISFGVPMICRPFFGDQKLNSRMVESVWEIGLQIEGGIFTKSGIISALDTFFNEEKGKILRENVEGLKEKALEAVKPDDGSSTENFKVLVELVKCHKST